MPREPQVHRIQLHLAIRTLQLAEGPRVLELERHIAGDEPADPPAESRRVVEGEILVRHGVSRMDPDVDHAALLRGQRSDERDDQRGECRNEGTHPNSG